MSWKNLSLGLKFAVGFGIVIVLLVLVGGWSITGIGTIVEDASQVIDGNKLRGNIVQKEVDHLNWCNDVNTLLTDDSVKEIHVQTDSHKCGFGQWYYSDERKKAEELVPELKPLLAAIEEPHKHLHESAIEIQQVFKQPHQGLAITLAERLEDHVSWAGQVGSTLAAEAGGMYTYQNLVKNAVNQAISVLEAIDNDDLYETEYDQQEQAMKVLKSMRFGPENTDYVWINDTHPRMVMHPIKPELDGQDISENTDSNGKKMFVEMANVCKANDEGFVSYEWPLPGSGKIAPKISYVKIYKPWNWIVGTGVFLNIEDQALIKRAREFAEGKPFTLGVQTDPAQCEFGKFLNDPQTQALRHSFPELDQALMACEAPHNHLHQHAIEIESLVNQNQTNKAIEHFDQHVIPTLDEVRTHIEEAIEAEHKLQVGLDEAKKVFATKTSPALTEVQRILGEVNKTVEANVMTDEQMLVAASGTRQGVIVTSVIAIIVGIVIAYIIAKGLIKPILQGVTFAQTIADGDLTQSLNIHQNDEIGQLADALNQMSSHLNSVMQNIQQAAEQVAASSEELSASSQNLANGATEQAASLEETSASIEQLTSSIEQNSDNSKQTDEVATQAAKEAEEGGVAVNQTVDAMKKIAEQISIIDDIADQTNLLALNAAIEAARAGEMGKGFAVVAVEVRKLAERSQLAAKEISELSANSVVQAENAGELIKNVVPAVQKASQLVQEISLACGEQSNGADQISTALRQLDEVTQQNSSTSEESASASEELASQAQSLQEMIAQFKITNETHMNRQTTSQHYTEPKMKRVPSQKPHKQNNRTERLNDSSVRRISDSTNGNSRSSHQEEFQEF
jgi:methyl-accepting chemotaxis protein